MQVILPTLPPNGIREKVTTDYACIQGPCPVLRSRWDGNWNKVFLAHVYAMSHVARGLFSPSDGQIQSRELEMAD